MLQDLGYNDFTNTVDRFLGGARAPMDVSIEVTRRCPLTCLHCYNNLPMGDMGARNHELSLDEHKQLLDELSEAGVVWLLYTGGEIFARKDFMDIYQYAKRKGFLITLFTNGVMIDEKLADELAEWRPLGIEITLYGNTAATYEALTGIPGSYNRCMRGIALLLERGLPLQLKTVPTKINQHEVYAMKRFAEQDLGVKFKYDPMVNPRVDCSQSPLEVRLSPEEVVRLELQDPDRVGAMRITAKKELEKSVSHIESSDSNMYICGGGHNSCAIDPYGNMSICVISHGQQYNWRTEGFRKGWDQFLGGQRERKKTRITKCTRCKLQSLCSMCPANGELENGDPEKPVEFLCHVAHLRAHAFGLQPTEHGECEFCAGGVRHGEILVSAEQLRNMPIEIPEWAPPFETFNILNNQSGSTCGSGCGKHV